MKRIRVLEIIDQPFLGGGQVNLLSLARFLDRETFEVSICSRGGGALVEEAQKHGIEHQAIPLSKKFNPKALRNLVSLIQNKGFDIIHTHGGVAGIYGRWAARRCGIPVLIHTLHGIHYLHYRNFLLKGLYVGLERFFSRFTQALIFVCDADRAKGQRFRLAPEEKMIVIKNGIDGKAIEAEVKRQPGEGSPEELGEGLSGPVVGAVARLHRQKGIPFLLQAARLILKDFPSAKFIVIGGGPLQQRLESLRQKLGLDQEVCFLGERSDVPRLLSRFDVFILPSLWEGLPYVLLEAAALGKPVVASDVDGIREIVKHNQTGLLVPARDPQSLAQAAAHLLKDRNQAQKLGEGLKQDVLPRFTLSRMVEKTQALYLRLYRQALREK